MTEGISEGDKFLCFEPSFYNNNSSRPIFKAGRIYESTRDGCIEDEDGNNYHHFSKPYWTKHLIKISSYDNAAAQKLNTMRIMKKHGYNYDFKKGEYVKIKTE